MKLPGRSYPMIDRGPVVAIDARPAASLALAIDREDVLIDATVGDSDLRFLAEMPTVYQLRKREQP